MELPKGRNRQQQLRKFAEEIEAISEQVGFPMSARGWGYILEGEGIITKDQIDEAEHLINECRSYGFLPVDFTAEEEARKFSGVEIPEMKETGRTPKQYMESYLSGALECEEWYTPNWWSHEEYYIQMLVEKIDLKTLFEPVCHKYHIPIATSKGWSSITQRASYARRFKEAEEQELKCILLYCGDYDPDGLRISDNIRNNLVQLSGIHWKDGTKGYDPKNLEIDRFGLNYDFIISNNLTWIENLITGSGKNLALPSHPNFHFPYVQKYLATVGSRKCEANAIVKRPDSGRNLCRQTIEKWLGTHSLDRFEERRQEIRDNLQQFRDKTGLQEVIERAMEKIKELKQEEE